MERLEITKRFKNGGMDMKVVYGDWKLGEDAVHVDLEDGNKIMLSFDNVDFIEINNVKITKEERKMENVWVVNIYGTEDRLSINEIAIYKNYADAIEDFDKIRKIYFKETNLNYNIESERHYFSIVNEEDSDALDIYATLMLKEVK